MFSLISDIGCSDHPPPDQSSASGRRSRCTVKWSTSFVWTRATGTDTLPRWSCRGLRARVTSSTNWTQVTGPDPGSFSHCLLYYFLS